MKKLADVEGITLTGVPKVALMVETSRGYGRQFLSGVVRYARLHGPWSFYLSPGDFAQTLPQMKSWGGTGIIARIETPQIAKAILQSGLPTIAMDLSEEQLLPDHPLSRLGEVSSDSEGAAVMAANHLLERGYRHLAFVGIQGRIWSQWREQSFCSFVRKAGYVVEAYPAPKKQADRQWDREQPLLAKWLADLPKPLGVMACNDERGRDVLEACRVAGIRVPEQLAVVGVDNDELLCELADPPLSSVSLDAEGTGYRCAAALDQMMKKGVTQPQRLKAKPLHVVTRRSTELFAIDDDDVAAALRFIHHHAAEPIQISDLVRHVAISRRKLEIQFQNVVGRTPHAELQRVRLERARRLLVETDLPVDQVAQSAGFSTPSYFIQVFRTEYQVTPARYRRHWRDRLAGE